MNFEEEKLQSNLWSCYFFYIRPRTSKRKHPRILGILAPRNFVREKSGHFLFSSIFFILFKKLYFSILSTHPWHYLSFRRSEDSLKIFKNWDLGMSIFTHNLTRPPLRRKKYIFKYRAYWTGFATLFQRRNR